LDQNKHLRTVRSFVRREGRLTVGQEYALTELWPDYGVDCKTEALDFSGVFGRDAPLNLEIGFGSGDALLAMAQERTQENFIGIEAYRPGAGRLISQLHENGVKNAKVIVGDAVTILKTCFPDACLSNVYLFFPDPWHKKRHHKRRIVQSEFAYLVASKLVSPGRFYMATDWQPYAEHMLKILSNTKSFNNLSESNSFTPRPDFRPQTKFERRGLKLGHGVWDLCFEKCALTSAESNR